MKLSREKRDMAMCQIESLGELGFSCLIGLDANGAWRVEIDTGWLSRQRVAVATSPDLDEAMLTAAMRARRALSKPDIVDAIHAASDEQLARLFAIAEQPGEEGSDR